jgi:sulfoquinovosidase
MHHRPAAPAIRLAIGNAAIEMIRGNFKITDLPLQLDALSNVSVEPNRVQFFAEGCATAAATLTLSQYPSATLLNVMTRDAACDRITLAFVAAEDEYIFGGGEQLSYLNLRGRSFPIWTSEPGVGRDKSRELTQIMDKEGMAGGDYWTTNYPQPTYLSSRLYACHLNSRAYSMLDFTDPTHHVITVWQNAATLEFFTADDFPALVSKLSDRSGKQRVILIYRKKSKLWRRGAFAFWDM